jgi:hypothetical protein
MNVDTFLVADSKFPILMQPRQRPLDNPTSLAKTATTVDPPLPK